MIFKKGCSVDPTTFIPDRAIEIATIPKGGYKEFIGYLSAHLADEQGISPDDLFREYYKIQKDPLLSGNRLKFEWEYLKSKRG